MFVLIVAVLTVVVGASWFFAHWLEEDKPALFTATLPGRLAAVALEQPAIIAILICHTVAYLVGLLMEVTVSRDTRGGAFDNLWEALEVARDYYREWVPAFVATGVMLRK